MTNYQKMRTGVVFLLNHHGKSAKLRALRVESNLTELELENVTRVGHHQTHF